MMRGEKSAADKHRCPESDAWRRRSFLLCADEAEAGAASPGAAADPLASVDLLGEVAGFLEAELAEESQDPGRMMARLLGTPAEPQPLPEDYDSLALAYEESAAAGAPGAHDGDGDADGAFGSSGSEEEEDGGGAAPAKQRIWVLFGGDGSLRPQSLAGGLHAFMLLQGDEEIEAEAFMLEPSDCGPR